MVFSTLGRVWDSVCGAFPQKTQKNPAKRFAPNALIPAACEGETRDLNWAAKNRRSELAAALRLFRSRLSPTQSQTTLRLIYHPFLNIQSCSSWVLQQAHRYFSCRFLDCFGCTVLETVRYFDSKRKQQDKQNRPHLDIFIHGLQLQLLPGTRICSLC